MDTATPFRHRSFPLSIHAGKGALDELRGEVDRAKAKRAFVVCGKSVARKTDLIARVKANLGDKFAGVFDGVEASSPLASVREGAAAARVAGADLIVVVGGGSAMVTARAIIILLAEKGDIHEICTQYPAGQAPVSPRLMAPKIPNILVVTTPSTAMTRAGTAVMDTETRHRLELFDPKTRPAAMIWDEDALLTAPADLYLSTSASAFSGVLTGVAAPRTNPLSHGDMLHALRLSVESLPVMRADPNNTTARMNLVAASFLSNRALDGMGGTRIRHHLLGGPCHRHAVPAGQPRRLIFDGDGMGHAFQSAADLCRAGSSRAGAGRRGRAAGARSGQACSGLRREFLPRPGYARASPGRRHSAAGYRSYRARCDGRFLSAPECAQGEAAVGAGGTAQTNVVMRLIRAG